MLVIFSIAYFAKKGKGKDEYDFFGGKGDGCAGKRFDLRAIPRAGAYPDPNRVVIRWWENWRWLRGVVSPTVLPRAGAYPTRATLLRVVKRGYRGGSACRKKPPAVREVFYCVNENHAIVAWFKKG